MPWPFRRLRPAAVTFIVPVFNKATYLEACLDSIRNQSLENTEIICVNDASHDGSGEILDQVGRTEPRLRLLQNATNLGAAESRNLGLKIASGRFIRFVDADDLLPHDSTEAMYRRALDSRAEVVRGSLALFRNSDRKHHQSVILVRDRFSTTLRDEPDLWIPWWHTSYMFSSDLIRHYKLQYPALQAGEDPVFLATVLVHARRISLLEPIVYLYRKYSKPGGSASSSFAALIDYLKHAKLVRETFWEYHPDCWRNGYAPFLFEDVQKIIARSALDAVHRRLITTEMSRIWRTESRSPP